MLWNTQLYEEKLLKHECWVLHKGRRPIDHIQACLITNMSINSRIVLTLLCTRSHNLGVEVALWNQNQPNIIYVLGHRPR